ncbi:N-acyl amino acid synthase FeeM domain-containing protein [Botrimarina mediterranea]|uniref:N-acyl amino acid synthase FeeM catalytic core domain-containing protein n=1 Tax=Botrimarina mediterranea TaxID=2528022 RepID=A0A518KBD4_9BACT|nr:hypothetical protein [Botrimarina mediterranea]QDV75100.1 hypothetical protein Spa11_33100 [Botrimarina mediterranea]QDV79746.1 hypothetical protein K2D_33620 [Planctomycetes bacterium K2D]
MSTPRPNSLPSNTSPNISLQLARTNDQYCGAFELAYKSYCRAGLDNPNEYGMRVTAHQLLDTSQVFVATYHEEVICTLTLVRDGELGLPMEAVYPQEIASRRNRGLRLAEVTCLADRRLSPKRFFTLFCELSRLMAQFAELHGVDEIWIACHPNHALLYERRLAFERQGELSDYPAVLGNPAVPLCVDLRELKVNYPRVWRQFFSERIAEDILSPSHLCPEQKAFYSTIVQHCGNVREGELVELA